MNNQKNDKQKEKKKGIDPVVVAFTGAAVGAGLAIAGAALTDDKNRKKIANVAHAVKDNVTNYIKEKQKQIKTEKKIISKRISDDKVKVNKLGELTKEVSNTVTSL